MFEIIICVKQTIKHIWKRKRNEWNNTYVYKFKLNNIKLSIIPMKNQLYHIVVISSYYYLLLFSTGTEFSTQYIKIPFFRIIFLKITFKCSFNSSLQCMAHKISFISQRFSKHCAWQYFLNTQPVLRVPLLQSSISRFHSSRFLFILT